MRYVKILSLLLISFMGLSACSSDGFLSDVSEAVLPKPSPTTGTFKVGTPYKIQGKLYRPKETYNFTETGIASWYGPNFHGKPTANGETFDMYELTAAHRTLQMPSLVRVTNLENGRSLVVRVNDRGPFSRGRIIDLSKRAAELLGFKNKGTAKVHLELLSTESKAIASAAKRGEDTSGVEVAMNEGRHVELPQTPRQPIRAVAPQAPVRQAVPQQPAVYSQASASPKPMGPVKGHIEKGKFLPDPIVQTVPVVPTNIFVQAGAFTNQDNAIRYAGDLSKYGNAQVYPALVNGQQFYRVRFGPLSDVAQADMVLNKLVVAGIDEAIIIVD